MSYSFFSVSSTLTLLWAFDFFKRKWASGVQSRSNPVFVKPAVTYRNSIFLKESGAGRVFSSGVQSRSNLMFKKNHFTLSSTLTPRIFIDVFVTNVQNQSKSVRKTHVLKGFKWHEN